MMNLTNERWLKQKNGWLLIGMFLFIVRLNAQLPVPAKAQTKSILLMNGTAHLGNGKRIENAVVGFENGKFTLVADATVIRVDMSKYDTVINTAGQHIYPGLISPNSSLGLMEVASVRATIDHGDVGAYNPDLRALIAYNTDSKIIPTTRTNGILLAQIVPSGGTISGTSAVVELDGWNWEDAVYKADDGVHLNWISMHSHFFNEGMGEEEKNEKKSTYIKQQNELIKFFADAKAYQEGNRNEKNIRFEAMRGLYDGSKTLFIHVQWMKEMIDAIHFYKTSLVKKMVVVGGRDAWMISGLLKENNIAVMLMGLHELPAKPGDDVDLPFKLPYLLQKAGVLFCLGNSDGSEPMQMRNLPFQAGTAVAYGLTAEEALQAVTWNTAKILGIEKTVGSIELGKDATFFVSEGDALDIKTNQVTRAFIRGKKMELSNHQIDLYEKYKSKYGIK